MVATGDMVALIAGLTALALFGAGQLFEFVVKFFDLPTRVVRVLSDMRGQVVVEVISNEPINVVVLGAA